MRLFRQHRHERQGGFNYWRFPLLGGFILLSVGVWIFLHTMDQTSHSESNPPASTSTASSSPALPRPPSNNPSDQNVTETFTFYRTLQDPSQAKSEPLRLEPKQSTTLPGRPAEPTLRATKLAPQPRSKGYILQVAAFRERSTAMNLISRLEKKGYSAYLSVHKIGSKEIWYRIRLGPYPTRSQAEVTARRLKTEERLHSYIARSLETP
jgi:cell division protein FtsN